MKKMVFALSAAFLVAAGQTGCMCDCEICCDDGTEISCETTKAIRLQCNIVDRQVDAAPDETCTAECK